MFTKKLPLLGALALGACLAPVEEEAPEVCAPGERTLLVEEKLTRRDASTPFRVEPGQELWLSVVADADYNVSTLFPTVAGLFLIEASRDPDVREDPNGFLKTDDLVISFDREGAWRMATTVPGLYRVWSRRGPEIRVAVCSAR